MNQLWSQIGGLLWLVLIVWTLVLCAMASRDDDDWGRR